MPAGYMDATEHLQARPQSASLPAAALKGKGGKEKAFYSDGVAAFSSNQGTSLFTSSFSTSAALPRTLIDRGAAPCVQQQQQQQKQEEQVTPKKPEKADVASCTHTPVRKFSPLPPSNATDVQGYYDLLEQFGDVAPTAPVSPALSNDSTDSSAQYGDMMTTINLTDSTSILQTAAPLHFEGVRLANVAAARQYVISSLLTTQAIGIQVNSRTLVVCAPSNSPLGGGRIPEEVAIHTMYDLYSC